MKRDATKTNAIDIHAVIRTNLDSLRLLKEWCAANGWTMEMTASKRNQQACCVPLTTWRMQNTPVMTDETVVYTVKADGNMITTCCQK